MTCTHRDRIGLTKVGKISRTTGEHVADVCYRCGFPFSLGPANDTPEALVEVRAAELADAWTPERGTDDDASVDEDIGWLMRSSCATHSCGFELTPDNDEHHAGWLAHAIAHHDEEQS